MASVTQNRQRLINQRNALAQKVGKLQTTASKTASYPIVAGDDGKEFDNTGAVGGVTITLLASASCVAKKTSWSFLNTAGQSLRIKPAGTDHLIGVDITGTPFDVLNATDLRSSQIGARIVVLYKGGGKFYVEVIVGAWTAT